MVFKPYLMKKGIFNSYFIFTYPYIQIKPTFKNLIKYPGNIFRHFASSYLATNEGGKPYVPIKGSSTDHNYLGT